MKYRLTLFLVTTGILAIAQNPNMPSDFLSKEWHKERRQKLREQLPPNSVAVFFANAVRNRSNDVDYVYHQDPDFYYLTGYREPHAVLLVFKDKQKGSGGNLYDEYCVCSTPQPHHGNVDRPQARKPGNERTAGF